MIDDPAVPVAPTPGRWRTPDAWPGPAIVAVTVLVAFVAGRNLWFFSDDWNIIAAYPTGRLLEPFNSHLSLVPVGVYQLLFHTVGLGSYVPFRIVGLLAYAVLGWVTWRFARERIGVVGGALATAAVLWNSGGVTNVMFPFLMNFSLPIAALAAIWWHLDHRSTRDDVTASGWLILALATSGLGLMTAVAVAVELAWRAVADRRIDWRRWLILAPGPALWFVWYLGYGVDSPASGGLRPVVSYAARMILGGFGSLVGGSRWLGAIVAAFMAGLIVAAAIRRTFDGRIAASLAAPLAFAVLTAISRIGVVPAIPPDELRYQWTIGAFLVLAFVLLLGATTDPESPLTWTSRTARPLLVLATLAVVANTLVLVGDVGEWNRSVERAVPGVRANLWVTEAAERAGVLDRDRALPVSYVKVTAGEYVDAVAELGSPLDGLATGDFGGSADSRKAADEALVAHFAPALKADGPDDCEARSDVGERTHWVPGGELYRVTAVDGATDIRFALFSDDADAPVIGTLRAGGSGFVRIPQIDDDAPVVARLTADEPIALTLCP